MPWVSIGSVIGPAGPVGNSGPVGLTGSTGAAGATGASGVSLVPLAAVRVATTTSGTLSTAFANGQTIDGVVLATNDRILIKNQASATENGVYTVNASGAPTRSADADTGAELVGAFTYVMSGTANTGVNYIQTTPSPITLGSSSIVWSQFSPAQSVTSTAPLLRTGRLTATSLPISTTLPASSVLIENDPGNLTDVLVTDTLAVVTRLAPGEAADVACTDIAQVYANGVGWEVLVNLTAQVPAPIPANDSDAFISLPAMIPPTPLLVTRVNAGASITADVEEAVPMGTGLRLCGYTVQDGGAGSVFTIVNGDTITNSRPIEYVSVSPSQSLTQHIPWGGADAANGISIDWVSGSFTLILRTKVA